MDLELKYYGNPILTEACADVQTFNEELKYICDAMYRLMLRRNGIGLAAPQVGILKNLIVVDTLEEEGVGRLNLINPKIIDYGKELVEYDEGCLSFPEVYFKIKRPDKILVKSKNLLGNDVKFEAMGLLSRVIQHEIDHLKGVLLIEKVTPKQRRKLDYLIDEINKMGTQQYKAKSEPELVRI